MPSDSLLLPLLEQTGVFAPGQAERLLSAERNPGEGLVAAAVRLGFAGEEEFLRAAANALGMEYVDVSERDLPRETAEKLPARAVTQYRVVPVSWDGDTLLVATSEPFDPLLADALRLSSGCDVALCACTREKIIRQSNKVYGVGADTLARMAESGVYEVDADANQANKFELDGGDQDAGDRQIPCLLPCLGAGRHVIRLLVRFLRGIDRRERRSLHIRQILVGGIGEAEPVPTAPEIADMAPIQAILIQEHLARTKDIPNLSHRIL